MALCRLLLSNPDMILLDEPTNHLDAESVAWLERFLHDFPGTVVAITHDRYFLDNAAGWILELDRGRGIPYEGNYSLTGWRQRSSAGPGKTPGGLAPARHQGRTGMGALQPQGSPGQKQGPPATLRGMQSQEFQSRNETNGSIFPGPRLGDKVIEVKTCARPTATASCSTRCASRCPKGSIVGIIGANGMGKSTLFKILMGIEQPDGGEVVSGKPCSWAYVDQSRDDLDGSKTVWQEVSDGLDIIRIGNYEVQSRSYLGRFNFKGADQQKFVKDLSGGERNRLHLAKLLKQGANVLLLDEPTNDLDVETLRALEEALLAFPGAALVISHDRWFLDRIATHILAYEDDGGVVFHEGNFTDYEADRKSRLGAAADQPHRLKYRKLK